jgi:trk system potassium uptake protein TrkA
MLQVRDDGTVDRRAGHVVIAHGDTVIEAGDHVIVFCLSKKLVRKIEALFQVSVGFL